MRYFAGVAKLGSIRKASEHLNISASAIDRQVLQAEEKFGVPLFERLPTGLRPTAAGELLLSFAGRWSRELEHLNSQIADLVGLRRGHVRIAVIDALATGFMSRQIAALRETFPAITVDVSVLDNIDVLPAIADGDVDFGIMLGPQTSKEITVLGHRDIALGLVVRPEHAFSALQSARFSRCIGEAIVAPVAPLAVHDQLRALQASTGITVRPVASSNNIQMLKSLITQGVGIGILTSLDVMEEVRRGELSFTPLSEPALRPLPLAICVGQARQLSFAAITFLRRIEQAFGEF